MENDQFYKLVQNQVSAYSNAHNGVAHQIRPRDVRVVFTIKILQNFKAIAATLLPDKMLYEITYDGDKQKVYIDAYKKQKNIEVVVHN